jgi:hypothetical protein
MRSGSGVELLDLEALEAVAGLGMFISRACARKRMRKCMGARANPYILQLSIEMALL